MDEIKHSKDRMEKDLDRWIRSYETLYDEVQARRSGQWTGDEEQPHTRVEEGEDAPGPSSCTLRLASIPRQWSEQRVVQLCTAYGSVRRVRLDRVLGEAVVTFDRREACRRALRALQPASSLVDDHMAAPE